MPTRTNFQVPKYDHPLLEEMIDNWDDESGVVQLVNNAYRLGCGTWKKLEDEKPTKEGRYLVWKEGSPFYMETMYWFEPTGDFFSPSVTHWMELPSPPAGCP